MIAALPVVDGSEWKAKCSVGLKINRLPFRAACKFSSPGMKQPARSSKLSATPRISHWSIKSFSLACSGSLSLHFSKTTGILSFWQIEQRFLIPCVLYDLRLTSFFLFCTLPLTKTLVYREFKSLTLVQVLLTSQKELEMPLWNYNHYNSNPSLSMYNWLLF